ncbi:hypothetical protein EYR36_003560 [Pleurotus pulmonarius]|nr:hypothetical protein EYR36_003560 [Pleurotus pulmonarius]
MNLIELDIKEHLGKSVNAQEIASFRKSLSEALMAANRDATCLEKLTISMNFGGLNTFDNVTAESLVILAGVIDGDKIAPEGLEYRILQAQLGYLQRKPRAEQTKIHSEVAAKYLPALADKFRNETGALNPAMTLLNVISYTPYFVRFLKTPGGQGIAGLQTKRTAEDAADIEKMDVDRVGEVGQFLATILLLQGTADVDEADKRALIPKLKVWERSFRGRLASETSGRCIAILADDPGMRGAMVHVKKMLEGQLHQCGGPGCSLTSRPTGEDLLYCSRCKSAVYCSQEHQKQAWSSHKLSCFQAAF